jgi:hypothetical protein
MKYLFAVLALLMVLFALVQVNDPDGPLWMLLYGVPAVWAGLAWMRPNVLFRPAPLLLLGASLAAGLVLVVVLWPPAEEWWLTSVWWESEASREGMGLMLAAGVLLAVFSWSLSKRANSAASGH